MFWLWIILGIPMYILIGILCAYIEYRFYPNNEVFLTTEDEIPQLITANIIAWPGLLILFILLVFLYWLMHGVEIISNYASRFFEKD